MKFLARTLIFLVLINGVLLYMHYKDAGNVTAKNNQLATYTQEVEVTNRVDGLYIKHHFTGLSDERQEIIWPKMSTNRSCYLEDTETCSRLDEDAVAFLAGEEDRQSIMYVIPKEKSTQQAILYKDVFVKLKESAPASSLLHLTDETDGGGSWVNGLALMGNKKMVSINYSLFSGYGQLTDLYWQKNMPPLTYEGNRLSVFGAGTDVEGFEEADDALLAIDAPHSTIVIDNTKPPVASGRFNITNEASAQQAVDLFLVNSMYSRFSMSKEDRLVAETVTSLLTEKATGAEKSRMIYAMLLENLTEDELGHVIKELDGLDGEVIDVPTMDEIIGEATGYQTSFFKENNNTDTVLYPFLLEDPRTVYIDGEAYEDIAVILKEGKILYPVTKIARELGFDVRSNEQSLYIEGETRKFRFPLKELFYVYNERKYDLGSVPFEQIGEEFYFEEAPFIRIFIIGLEKTDDRINIVPRVK